MSESSPPVADPQPERVDVTCDSWDQFENVFRRRLQSHQVFVPSVQPPPVGSQLEFRFSIPDGTSISMPGRVVSSFPPGSPSEPSSAERAGMIVEFGKFARAEEQRVRALLASLEEHDRLGAFAPEVPPVPPVRAPSTPSRSPTDDAAVSEAVQMMELHQYPEAIRLLVDVLNADPDKRVARLWLNLAGARYARAVGEVQVSADCYRAVLDLQPDHAEARQQLSLLPPARPSAPQLGVRTSLLERLIGKKR